jgi:anti-anti-sigma regulatory factor
MPKIDLVSKITPDSAQALWYQLEAEFEGLGSKPMLDLNAGAVRHLSSAGLQVLLMARKRALHDGGALRIHDPSEAFLLALTQMGGAALLDEVAA